MMDKPKPQEKSPIVAGLLSAVIPGMGQVYARQAYRGAVIFIGTMLVLAMVIWYRHPIWYIAPLGIWLWNVVDAASLAAGRKRSFILPLLLGLLAAYGIGWQVSQIDFSKASLSRAYLVVRPMFKPDFVEPRREENSIWVGVQVPCSPAPPKAFREDSGKTARCHTRLRRCSRNHDRYRHRSVAEHRHKCCLALTHRRPKDGQRG